MSTVTKAQAPAATQPPLPGSGRLKQKLRTRRHLVATAAALLRAGGRPTVAEAADAADVSRRTAYRYFPTQAKLLIEAALEGVWPHMREAIAAEPNGAEAPLEQRVDRLVTAMQRLTAEQEHLLRALVQLTVLEPPAGDVPRRGMRRVEWIEAALRPGASRLPRAAYLRLVSALSVCTGIEAFVVLRDIRGLSTAQAVELSRWMARAILRQALADARAPRRGR